MSQVLFSYLDVKTLRETKKNNETEMKGVYVWKYKRVIINVEDVIIWWICFLKVEHMHVHVFIAFTKCFHCSEWCTCMCSSLLHY